MSQKKQYFCKRKKDNLYIKIINVEPEESYAYDQRWRGMILAVWLFMSRMVTPMGAPIYVGSQTVNLRLLTKR